MARYIFAAPFDAITVVHRGFTEIYAVNTAFVKAKIGGDLSKASLPIMAAPFPHAADGRAVATDALVDGPDALGLVAATERGVTCIADLRQQLA